MTVIINEGNRGILTKNGRFARLLRPGKHCFFGSCAVETVEAAVGGLYTGKVPADILLGDPEAARELTTLCVPADSVAMLLRQGSFIAVLGSGSHTFWTLGREVEVRMIDVTNPAVKEEDLKLVPPEKRDELFCSGRVYFARTGLLFYDGRLEKTLDPGKYYFWDASPVVWKIHDTSTGLRLLDVSGQQLLTKDLVTIRVNLVCSFRVTDILQELTGFVDHPELVRAMVQLALREQVGAMTLDELLEGRQKASEGILAALRLKEAEYSVSFAEVGVKDIILPGEIRDIMNTVLVAEKKAQANVIARREEAASTRSLLNTAKLLDENSTLMRLKELEYLERICGSADSLNVNGGANLLGQLQSLVKVS